MNQRKKENNGVFGLSEGEEDLVFSFFGHNTSLLYRQWIEGGRRISIEQLTDLAEKLICDGMSSVVSH